MIERARPRDGLGVRVRTGLPEGLLGDFDFARGISCAERVVNDLEGRFWLEEDDEGGRFSS